MCLQEEVVQIPITRLRTFPNHPFYVRDDDMMQQLIDSIWQVGILAPVIVRMSEDEFYEIISGHRRTHACEKLGFETVPAIIKDVDQSEATISCRCRKDGCIPCGRGFISDREWAEDASADDGQ